MKIRILATAALMMFFVLGQAQKLGHINSTQLLIDHPKIKSADEQVLAFQQTQEAEFQAKAEAFQNAYQAFVAKAQSQEYSEVQLQKEQQELVQKEQQLQLLQQQLQQKIIKKREELYAPILLEVEEAVQAIGKENEYTMIFDTSLGQILYGVETQDITSLVKAKLGF